MGLESLDSFLEEYNTRSAEPDFDPTQFTQDFQRGLDSSGVNRVQPESEAQLKGKGILRQTVDSVAGSVTDIGVQWMQAVRSLDPQGGNDVIRDFATSGINSIRNFVSRHPSLEPNPEVEAGVRRWWVEGVRSFLPSIAASVPGGVIGLLAGSPVGAVIGGGASAALIFGLAELDSVYEEGEALIAERMANGEMSEAQAVEFREELRTAARLSAATEGGLEGVANAVQLRVLGKFLPGRQALKNIASKPIKELFKKTPGQIAKDAARTLAITTPVEVSTEFAQAALETKFRRDIGLTDQNAIDAGFMSVGPTLITNALFFGAGRGVNSFQRYSIRRSLEDARTDPNKRAKAVRDISNIIRGAASEEINPKKKKQMLARADRMERGGLRFVQEGLPMNLDTNIGVQTYLGQYVKGLQLGEITIKDSNKLEEAYRTALESEDLSVQDRVVATQRLQGIFTINRIFESQERISEKPKIRRVKADFKGRLINLGNAAVKEGAQGTEEEIGFTEEVVEDAPEALEELADEITEPTEPQAFPGIAEEGAAELKAEAEEVTAEKVPTVEGVIKAAEERVVEKGVKETEGEQLERQKEAILGEERLTTEERDELLADIEEEVPVEETLKSMTVSEQRKAFRVFRKEGKTETFEEFTGQFSEDVFNVETGQPIAITKVKPVVPKEKEPVEPEPVTIPTAQAEAVVKAPEGKPAEEVLVAASVTAKTSKDAEAVAQSEKVLDAGTIEEDKVKDADRQENISAEEIFRDDPPAIPSKGKVGKIVKKSTIIKDLEKKLLTTIRIGRFRGRKGVLGIFKTTPQITRVKYANDVDTVAHETGHFLNKTIFEPDAPKLTGKAFKEFANELEPIATKGTPLVEGFAEFVRRYVVDINEAKAVAPKFFKWFDNFLETKHPETKAALVEARTEFALFKGNTSLEKVMGQISFDEGKRFRLPNFSKIYTLGKDKLYPIKQAVDALDPDIEVSKDPYILARTFADWMGTAEQFLRHGQIKPDFKIGQNIGPSLEAILAPIQTKHKEFSAWLIASRSLELGKRGKLSGISTNDAKQVVEELSTPEFITAKSQLDQYQDSLLEFLLDSGHINREQMRQFKELNKQYVPFYRLMEADSAVGGVGKGFTSMFQPVQRLSETGSTREIVDPIESIIKNTYAFINLAKQNNVKKALVDLAEAQHGGGKIAERLPTPVKPVAITNNELYTIFGKFANWKETTTFKEFEKSFNKKFGIKDGVLSKPLQKMEGIMKGALVKRGMTEGEASVFIEKLKGAATPEDITSAVETVIERQTIIHTVKEMELDIPNIVNIFRPSLTMPKGNFMQVYKNGKRVLYELDPDLHAAIAGLDLESTNIIVKALAIPARALRAGATLTPEFSLRNVMRDPFSAFVFSKTGFIPVLDTIKGFFHAVGRDDMYQAFRVGGGGHSMLVSLDRSHLQTNMKELLNDTTTAGRVKNIVQHPIESLRIMSELFEASNRVDEFSRGTIHYDRRIAAVLKDAVAAPNTLDTSKPFKTYKVAGKSRQAENTKASLEKFANVLEKEKVINASFGAREVTLDFARIGAQARALNQIIAFWNARLEGLDKIARSFRDRPVISTMKSMAAITVPSMLLWAVNKDDERYQELPMWEKMLFWHIITDKHIWRIPKPFELGILFGSIPERIMDWMTNRDPQALKEIQHTLLTTTLPSFWPTGILPFWETWANKSRFLNRPIVGRGQEKLEPRYQSRPWTGETAKAIGNILNYSPSKIEHFVIGFTGGLGKLALEGSDKLITKFIDEPIDPSPRFSDIPVLRAFTTRWPTSGARSIKRFYDEFGRLEQISNTQKNMIKTGVSKDIIKEFFRDNKKDLIKYGTIESIFRQTRTNMSMGHKLIAIIHNNTKMTASEKREKIDRIYLSMITNARNALKLVRQK